jgi:hypothetical protein
MTTAPSRLVREITERNWTEVQLSFVEDDSSRAAHPAHLANLIGSKSIKLAPFHGNRSRGRTRYEQRIDRFLLRAVIVALRQGIEAARRLVSPRS